MEAVRRTTCVFAAIVILMYSTQGLAQNKPSTPSGSDEFKQRIAEALARSKPITVRVNDPKVLSGTAMGKEATGLVKSMTDTCFQLEYTDRLNEVQKDCIPYGDVASVKWHSKTLHVLKLVGEGAGIAALVPIFIPVWIIAALAGHPLVD
jgi:hypothetical protein